MKLIVTADWHLRKDVPACRTENEEEWFDFQFDVVAEIVALANKYDAVLAIAGDIFDRAVPSQKVINRLSRSLNSSYFISSAGNHDLPYHNFNLVEQAGYGGLLLHKNRLIRGREEFLVHEFNTPLPEKEAPVVLCHHLCFKDTKSMPPNVKALTADELLDMYPFAKLIICGDNHTGFVHKQGGRVVIVPGATTVQNASQAQYAPAVYLVDCKDEAGTVRSVERIELNNPADNINLEYKERQDERDERIDNFVQKIRAKKSVSFSFSDNLNEKLKLKTVSQAVKNIINEIQEEV